MAYITQERKSQIAIHVKEVCKRFGVKASLSISNHSTLNCTIKSADIDFFANNQRVSLHRRPHEVRSVPSRAEMQLSKYHLESAFDGTALQFLEELFTVMNSGNHDNSDVQTDYFDVGWYTYVNIGKWDKPFEYTGK
jgi:hypothetical protein